jgi:NAD-dependent dihydropyrimidine dehydrogenase PreA subunit
VQIDEDKCDGCGQCVPGCEEGAIRIVGGKARLVSDVYCDGLGACLGHCPRGAISLVEREADEFDEAAVARQLAATRTALPVLDANTAAGGGCPGLQARQLRPANGTPRPVTGSEHGLTERPRPPRRPVWRTGRSNCGWFPRRRRTCRTPTCCWSPIASLRHGRLSPPVSGWPPVLIGCPKLDDGRFYVQKLAQIVHAAQIRSITVVRMEVPCCMGLMQIAQAAIELANGRY